jgi:ribosome-associated toxin RatA of RatAB toxin-antitoxin module
VLPIWYRGAAMAPSFLYPLRALRVLAALWLGWLACAAGAAEPSAEMAIEVARSGETFIVNALLFAPVTRREAWAVLTDFDHMTSYVPNLAESRVLERSGNRLTVAQNGVARFGKLDFPFESVREVELTPEESVRSRNIRGTVRKLESVTQLSEAEGGTRISYRVEMILDWWFSNPVGEAFLEHEIHEQFDAIVKEMRRRQALPATSGKAAP